MKELLAERDEVEVLLRNSNRELEVRVAAQDARAERLTKEVRVHRNAKEGYREELTDAKARIQELQQNNESLHDEVERQKIAAYELTCPTVKAPEYDKRGFLIKPITVLETYADYQAELGRLKNIVASALNKLAEGVDELETA